MKKKFSSAISFVIVDVAVRVGADVHVDEPSFRGLSTGFDFDVGVAKIGCLRAKTFDFGAGENESSLQHVFDEIVGASVGICRDELLAGFPGFGLPLSLIWRRFLFCSACAIPKERMCFERIFDGKMTVADFGPSGTIRVKSEVGFGVVGM